MAQHDSNPKRESDPYSLPNVETFTAPGAIPAPPQGRQRMDHWKQVAKQIERKLAERYGKQWRSVFVPDVQEALVMAEVAVIALGWEVAERSGERVLANMQALTIAARRHFGFE